MMTTKTTEYIGANGWGSLSLSELLLQKLKWSLPFSSCVLKPHLAAFSHFPLRNEDTSKLVTGVEELDDGRHPLLY